MQTNIIDLINFIPPEISSIQLPNSNILKNLLIFEKSYFKENWLLSIQCKLKLPVQFSVNNLFTFQATINNSSNFPHNLHIGSKENHSMKSKAEEMRWAKICDEIFGSCHFEIPFVSSRSVSLIKIFLVCVFIISGRKRVASMYVGAKSTNWCIFKSFDFMFTICFYAAEGREQKKECFVDCMQHTAPCQAEIFLVLRSSVHSFFRHKMKWTWRKPRIRRAGGGGEKMIINYSYHTIQ